MISTPLGGYASVAALLSKDGLKKATRRIFCTEKIISTTHETLR
jgi:hypothetical protein